MGRPAPASAPTPPERTRAEASPFSPTDLMAAALGSCMMTTMGITAQRLSLDLTGATVKVTKEMVTAPVRRAGRLSIEIFVPGEIPPEHRQRLERSAMHCPVHKSLHPDIDLPVTFRWGVG